MALIRSFAFSGKLGRDTPLTADLRGRAQGREVIYLETNDAGAFFRFTDTYSKVIGGQLTLAMDPPTADPGAKEGLVNVRDFVGQGGGLARARGGGRAGRGPKRRHLLAAARGVHPAQRTAHDPRGRREGPDRSAPPSKAASTIPATRCA